MRAQFPLRSFNLLCRARMSGLCSWIILNRDWCVYLVGAENLMHESREFFLFTSFF